MHPLINLALIYLNQSKYVDVVSRWTLCVTGSSSAFGY